MLSTSAFAPLFICQLLTVFIDSARTEAALGKPGKPHPERAGSRLS
jgi:hypothetical protein